MPPPVPPSQLLRASASGDRQMSAIDDIVQLEGRYYVRATATLADEFDRVLKHGDSFAVFDRQGDIRPLGMSEEGFYHDGTRHLSRLVLRIGQERPLLLGSTARADNSRLAIDLANPELDDHHGGHVLPATVHLARSKVLVDDVCYERIEARNFGDRQVRLPLSLRFGADFADIFEVRGTPRESRGRRLEPRTGDDRVLLGYAGLDGLRRRTRLSFSPRPDRLTDDEASWELRLQPGRSVRVEVTVAAETGRRKQQPLSFDDASARAAQQVDDAMAGAAVVSSSSERFNDWLHRSYADVAMMATRTEYGLYPYAGVPWFSTPFGRDGIITALQCLWLAPQLAIGTLRFLAATQAEEDDPERDAQPGKIVHELRRGEMAATGEVPFARYYGSHDATPLFVMLAAETWRRTGDLALARELWPNVERALAWLDDDADPDGDGFSEYASRRSDGLVQQGWKDSHDSIFHADGSTAPAPIALAEVQAYVYGARMGAAELAGALGDAKRAERERARAEELRQRFEEAFWDEELGTYVLALDGENRPCRVVTSNAGHCLATGIASPERAARVAEVLMSDRSFSGWGIRTAAAGEARYNPMSYHNGSVWPHDNAMVARGLGRYGHWDAAARVLRAIYESSLHYDLLRLPELFCGFTRRPGEGPTRYPVACSPQAWAAGSVFMLLAACIGLEVDAVRGRIQVGPGRLPTEVDELRIERLVVGDVEVDLALTRQADGVGVDVLRRTGPVEIVVVK